MILQMTRWLPEQWDGRTLRPAGPYGLPIPWPQGGDQLDDLPNAAEQYRQWRADRKTEKAAEHALSNPDHPLPDVTIRVDDHGHTFADVDGQDSWLLELAPGSVQPPTQGEPQP